MLTDNKSRIQVLVLAVILLGVGFYYLSYQPAVAARDAARQQYDVVAQEISYGRERAQNLQRYAQQILELRAKVDEVESRLSGGNRILLFLQALEDGATEAGVSLSQLEPLSSEDLGETVEQSIAVQFTGSLPKTDRFIQIIEQLCYPSEVRQAQFEAADSGELGQLTTNLQVVLFSLKGGGV